MIGIIKRPNINIKSPINPDDYFDPTTHIATEANFIAFLEAGGKYDDKSLVGYKVQLGNSVDYNNGLWVIADVNHDSENTGQSNCYDLISQDSFHYSIFGPVNNSNRWRDSDVRTWLNNTFYPGFSSTFKTKILNIRHNSQGDWFNDNKIILPSKVEINTGAATDNEGVPYPIFTDNTSRIKNQFGDSAKAWWTRSRSGTGAWIYNVTSTGSVKTSRCYDYYMYLAPILRVQ